MVHHAHQSGVAAASSLIVFSVNLSGITGIDEKTGSMGKTDQEGQRVRNNGIRIWADLRDLR
jgi:hypothetical protein